MLNWVENGGGVFETCSATCPVMREMAESKTHGDRLLTAILEIQQLLAASRTDPPASSDVASVPNRLGVLRSLVYSEFSEIMTILSMLYDNVDTSRSSAKQMNELQRRIPSGPIDESSADGKVYIGVINRQRVSNSRLEVLIKVLYEWIYHLSELLKSPQMRRLVSAPLWLRLQSYCAFRGRLVTHQQDAAVPLLKGAMRFSADFEKIELILTPFDLPEAAIRELNGLFSQCANELTEDESKEQNLVERCKILSTNLDRFQDARRGRIVSFIGRFGTVSDTPVNMVQFLRDLAAEILPKLAELKD